MKHRIPIIALTLLMASCLAAEPTTKPATTRPGSSQSQAMEMGYTIKVGMPLSKAQSILKKIGAGDITGTVSFALLINRKIDHEYLWYVLPGRTTLNIYAERPVGNKGDFTIKGMVLGEKGRGFGGKDSWFSQKKTNPTAVVVGKAGLQSTQPPAGASTRPATKPAVSQVSYEEAFADLYEILGREYPCFDLKQIDWKAVGKELLPQAKQVKTDEQFGLLCMKLVARLEDSHAHLRQGKVKPPSPPFPRWDPGLACLIDNRGKPVVYYIDKGGPAEKAGVKIGMTVLSVNGKPAEQSIKDFMIRQSTYWGYSSQRYLKYHSARFFIRQMKKGDAVTLEMQEPNGRIRTFKLPATLGMRYLRRLPVPIKGISDTKNVSWTMLDNDIGYIYVRRIRRDLIKSLDRAVAELKDARGLIIDVRGNSGGGFNARRAHRNFALDDKNEPKRPRFKRPMALLIDSRCISAGEGWASWFIARKRAKVFGSATAGASSRKRAYTLKNGLYKVTFPVKAYRGFLDRPIERRGLEPDVKVRQSAQDLAAGRDTVLQAARKYLVSAAPSVVPPATKPADRSKTQLGEISPLVRVLLDKPDARAITWRESPFFQALVTLVRRQKRNVQDFMGYGKGRAEIVRIGDKELIVAIAETVPLTIPGTSAQRIILLDRAGNILDMVSCSINSRYGLISTVFKDKPDSDGARMVITFPPNRWHNWHRIIYRGKTYTFREDERNQPPEWDRKDLCRIGIKNRRLVVLFPMLWPRPGGSELEFRLVASKRGSVLENVERYIKELTTRGPKAANSLVDEIQWFEIQCEAPNLSVTAKYGRREYILLSNVPRQRMLSHSTGPKGKAWGLKRVYLSKDARGRPAVAFVLDADGARLFQTFAETYKNRVLAILADGKVLYTGIVRLKASGQSVIEGDFTEQQARNLVEALKVGMVNDPKNSGAAILSDTQPARKTASRPATTAPTTTTRATTTTTSAPAVDPKVMAILKRLEAAGEKYPNITAKIDFNVDMLQTGDTESRTGKVYYQGPSEKDSAKFRIHFDTLRQGKGPKIKDVVDYAFDGAWLTVRKERIKQMNRYQVARPGEKVNPLQLGKGPFPVPFGQKADAVIKHFQPTTRPAKKTDPKDTDYIKLTTRRQYRKEFSVVWLEMWIDRKTSLPVKIIAEDRSENQTTVIFKDTKTPKSFDKKIFTLPRPPAGWEYHVERFKK